MSVATDNKDVERQVDLPPTAAQLDLLNVPAAQFVAKLEAAGNYTGERLKAQKPEVYDRVLMLLSQGHGSQYIQDQTGVSKNTVKAVRKAEGETIDLVKTRLAEQSFDFAEQAHEAAATILTEIMSSQARRSVLTVKDVQALQTAASAAVTNGQLLTGKPTANVSVAVFSQPSEDLNAQITAHIAGLKSAATHSAAEKNGGPVSETAATTPRLALPVEIEAARSPISARDDKQSPVPATQPTENQ